jgi:hypothetical protein
MPHSSSLRLARAVLQIHALAAAAALTAACDHGGASDAGSSGSSSVPAAADGGVTLTSSAIDALARAVLTCSTLGTTFDATCPAMRAWTDARAGFEGGKADAELVALLADQDEKIRYLAALKLNQHGARFRVDRALAQAAVRAAAQEKSAFAGFEVGSAIGRIRVAETGTLASIVPLVKHAGAPAFRLGVLSEILHTNPEVGPVFELVKDAVKDADHTVALGALRAFWTGGASKPAATCDIYAENVDNADVEVAAEASNALSWYGKCASRYDVLLDSLERRVKTGPSALGVAPFMTAARHLCVDATSTAKQKQRAAQVGRTVAGKPEFKIWVRSTALDTVWACESSTSARAFVTGFRSDSEKPLADKARELLVKK